MKRRDLLTNAGAVATLGAIAGGEILFHDGTKHRIERGFASILDVAGSSGEPRGTGISFPTPFSNYGPKSITYLIISEYNIASISITPPTPFGARFTVVARDPGEFECSIVWTAEE